MTFRTLTLAAVAALVTGTASAQMINPGDVQLSLKAGVEPGVYSTSQLVRLLEAQRENRTAEIDFILREANETATRMSTAMPAGESTDSFGSGINSMNY